MTDQLPAAAAAVDCAADVVVSATDHLARESTVDGRISVARLDEHRCSATTSRTRPARSRAPR